MFLEFMNRVNQLYRRPEWYNAFYENCMTSAFRVARKHATPGHDRWHWSVLLNGHAPEQAYDLGMIDTSLPFEKLKAVSLINDRARAAGGAYLFSARIREGIPGIDETSGSVSNQ
jgi:hypothetical protein